MMKTMCNFTTSRSMDNLLGILQVFFPHFVIFVGNEELAGNIGPSDNGVINNQSLIERNNKTDGHKSYAGVVRRGTVAKKQ